MSQTSQKNLALECFSILEGELLGLPVETNNSNEKVCLFVTWKKQLKNDMQLRGCIGSFQPRELNYQLRHLAISSAFKDSRFSPIQLKEFNQLHCTVSLLEEFEVCEDHLDWIVGVHGISISFDSYSACFLPQVPEENGWSRLETLERLIRKSGYAGNITSSLLHRLKVERFSSRLFHASYEEYSRM